MFSLPKSLITFFFSWKTDEVFGWQIMNGIYPLSFKVVKKIPSYFNVTDDDLKHLLRSGTSIESEIKVCIGVKLPQKGSFIGNEWSKN